MLEIQQMPEKFERDNAQGYKVGEALGSSVFSTSKASSGTTHRRTGKR